MGDRQRGFVIIELLIVIEVYGGGDDDDVEKV